MACDQTWNQPGTVRRLIRGRAVYRVCLILTALIVQGFTSCAVPLQRYQFEEPHMGTSCRVVLYAADSTTAHDAARAAFDRIAALDAMLSDYVSTSELSRLSRVAHAAPTPVSDDLWRVLVAAHEVSVQTEGAFDVTVGPFVRLWRRARRLRAVPTSERLATARQQAGYDAVRFHSGQRIELMREGMRLDVGGIAKGYVAEAALDAMRALGVARALVDAGGDVCVSDAPPGEIGWLVEIQPYGVAGEHRRGIRIENASVATSGDAYRFVEIGGVRYSHIVDPRTGIGLTARRAAAVVAPSAALADALASALCVLGAEQGFRFINEYPGVSALVQEASPAGTRERITPGFPAFVAGPTSPTGAPALR